MSVLQKKKKHHKPTPEDPFICSCNFIPQSQIEAVMKKGGHTLNDIFDATTAGLGACGGSCRPIIKKMLEHYEATGELLKDPKGIQERKLRKKTK